MVTLPGKYAAFMGLGPTELIVILIIFGTLEEQFLTARNFTNLLLQMAPVAALAMGIVFILLILRHGQRWPLVGVMHDPQWRGMLFRLVFPSPRELVYYFALTPVNTI